MSNHGPDGSLIGRETRDDVPKRERENDSARGLAVIARAGLNAGSDAVGRGGREDDPI
jgi:hypothetical protein